MLNDEVVRLSIDKEDWTGCEMKDSNMKKKEKTSLGGVRILINFAKAT
jgi:hypothetical protein